ncbi:MAG: hypothetical protein ACLSVD_13530 [Eggerthellaceae bacterium]
MQAQVEQILGDLDEREARATESFVKEGGSLGRELARHEAERARLAASLPADLLAAYERRRAAGGVAVGVCRRELRRAAWPSKAGASST